MGVAAPMAVGAARGLLARGRALVAGARGGAGSIAAQRPPTPEFEPPPNEHWVSPYAVNTRPEPYQIYGTGWTPLTVNERASGDEIFGGDGLLDSPFRANDNELSPEKALARRTARDVHDAAPVVADEKAPTPEDAPQASKPAAPVGQFDPILPEPWGGVEERNRRLAAFNERVINFGLAPLGEMLPYELSAGPSAIDYLKQQTAKAYDRAANLVKTPINDSKLVAATQKGYADLADEPEESQNAYKAFLIAHVVPEFANGDLDGDGILDLQSNIDDLANTFKRTDHVTRPVGLVLDRLNNHITDAVDRHNPGYANAKRAADAASAIQDRLVRASEMAKDNGGIFTPEQLMHSMDHEAAIQGDFVTSAGLFPLHAITHQADALINSSDPWATDKITALRPREYPYRFAPPYQWSGPNLPVPANDWKAPNAFTLRDTLSRLAPYTAGPSGLAPSWITAGSYLAPSAGQSDSQ
jgi:hypothetical protein